MSHEYQTLDNLKRHISKHVTKHQAEKHVTKHQKTQNASQEAFLFVCCLESGQVNRFTTGEIDDEPWRRNRCETSCGCGPDRQNTAAAPTDNATGHLSGGHLPRSCRDWVDEMSRSDERAQNSTQAATRHCPMRPHEKHRRHRWQNDKVPRFKPWRRNRFVTCAR